MKKLLAALAVAGTAITVATACACNQTAKPETPFSHPIINVSTVQYEKGTTLSKQDLEADILAHVHVSYDDHQVSAEKIHIEITKNNVDLTKEGSYEVELQIEVEGITVTKTINVSVSTAAVFRVKQKAKLAPFTPMMEMTDADMPNFESDIHYYIGANEIQDVNLKPTVKVNTDSIRWAVPGIQTVKYEINYKHAVGGPEYTYEYFRDIRINAGDLPTYEAFSKYFTHDTSGISCNYGQMITNNVKMPVHLMIPAGYVKNGITENIERAEILGCDTEADANAMNLWSQTKSITLQKGYKSIGGQFLELSLDKDDANNSKIAPTKLNLPETLTRIEGKNVFAGLKLNTLMLPSSLANLQPESLLNIWGLETMVFASMPVPRNSITTIDIINSILNSYYPGLTQGYQGLELYFWFGYLLGESSDTRAVNRTKELIAAYNWQTDKAKYINFYTNPYKL